MLPQLRFKPAERFLLFFIVLAACALAGSLIVGFVVHNGPTTKALRLATVIQDCVIFILPSLITAVLISSLPANFLKIESAPSMKLLILAVTAMMVSIPLMNWIVMMNDSLVFPESLSGLENWMRLHENEARASVKILLGDGSVSSLIIDLLIVGILAGLSEEILFRGTLQQLFLSSGLNIHLSIWITAIIFSAIHMQFFGFVPRLLLGAYFGYLLWWSRSLWLPVIIHAFNNSIVVYSTWKSGGISEGGGGSSIDQWGLDSPMLILASAILTVFIIFRLHREQKSAVIQRVK